MGHDSPHPNPPPQGGREPCSSLPPCGGGSLVPPSPLVGEGWGGGEWFSLPHKEGALFLPPPLWGRVGVGGERVPPATRREPCSSLPPCGGGLGWGGKWFSLPHKEGALFLPLPLWGRVGGGEREKYQIPPCPV